MVAIWHAYYTEKDHFTDWPVVWIVILKGTFLTTLYKCNWTVTVSFGFTTQKGFIQPAACPTGGWYIPVVQQVEEVADELEEGEEDAQSPPRHLAKAVLSHLPDCGGLSEHGSPWCELPTYCSVWGLGCCESLGVILPQQWRSEPACSTDNTNGGTNLKI